MTDRRPRVLLVTRNLPPLVGGMERLNWHIADELAKCADVNVVGPEGAGALMPAGVGVTEIQLRPLQKFIVASAWRAARMANDWRPDIVMAGSGLTAPAALIAARASRSKAVAYVHGLDLTVRHPMYRAFWLPAIRRMDKVLANSSPTAQLAEASGVAKRKLQIVHPGVELPYARRSPEALREFRLRHGLGEGPVLLSIGRLTSRKGLREFVEKSLPSIVSAHPNAVLAVVGGVPKDALHAQLQTQESIQSIANRVGVGSSLRFLGVVSDSDLSCAYECAAVHVFPVREIEGDQEGFGMVAIEAAAHGVFTVAFASGGVVDSVLDGVSGSLVEPNDYEEFACAVIKATSSNAPTDAAGLVQFASSFAWPEFGRRIVEAIRV